MYNFIINPTAGGGRAKDIMTSLEQFLVESGIEYAFHYTKYVKHGIKIAFDLAKSGQKNLICCGGDGTINEVVNGVLLSEEKDVAVGFLPCGTGNDFMRSAGLSLDVYEALKTITDGNTRKVDAINVGGIYEICFANSGVDAEIVRLCNQEKVKKKMSYVKNLFKCLKNLDYEVKITTENETYEGKCSIVSVLNGWSIASGLKYCVLAKVDDGLMDIMVVTTTNKFWFLFTLIMAAFGKALRCKNVVHISCKKAKIEASTNIVDIDGELYFDHNFEAEIKPAAINIFG